MQSFLLARWKVLGVDGGGGCTTTGRYVTPLKCTLKNGSGGEFDVVVFFCLFVWLFWPQFKKREEKRKKKKSIETESRVVGAGAGGELGAHV